VGRNKEAVMIKVKHVGERVIEAEIDGKLLHDDYVAMIPVLEEAIREHGKLRCVIVIGNLAGFEPRAMLDDLKFDLTHIREIERCAIVCEPGWVAWMTQFWGLVMPFTKVKRFDVGDAEAARVWAEGDE
jgi:SpoIIAA-like